MIPALAHFIWFGTALPWVHALSIQSAAARGGFERVILHHADDLSDNPWWEALLATERFEARRLDPEAAFTATGPRGPQLAALFKRLTQPAARANMVRAALLYAQGGVYLDLDTVTLKPLDDLRHQAAVFCGEEAIVLPHEIATSRSPGILAAAGVRLAVRDVLRRAPDGWRAWRKVEGRYHRAVNNAVLACEPEHAFVEELLDRMVTMDPQRQLVRFALGTHLLQQTVTSYKGDDLTVHDPEVFYPLPPEISEHWFRQTKNPRLDDVLSPRTSVVHWYASVRTRDIVPQITPEYVRRHADTQLFSAMALPFIKDGAP